MLSKIDVEKFNTLIEINTLINSDYRDLNALLAHILESAARLCRGDAASLLLADHEKQVLHFEVALGAKGEEVKKFTVKMGEGIAGWVALHNKSTIVNDVAHDSRHLYNIPTEIGYPSKTMLAVPLRAKGKVIGVIQVINKIDEKEFTQEDLEWLELFSDQAAIAIANAKNLERVHSEIQHLHDKAVAGEGFHTLIGRSRIIREKIELVNRLAKSDSSVLILGESGVGKEVFAEQVHIRSHRNHAPFVRVNCAALPEGLLESELFGHVKGAFTSAVSNRRGRFEMANGGTIFLDEIGDLPLGLQAKLLRVIQEKTFEKVGSDQTLSVNVRILAATNKDIEALVEKGEFRSDLYYRLNVLPLVIPPLRQHPEDIPDLAQFFLLKFTRANLKQFEGFSSNAIEAMLTYSWPGNIRELQNCVERACVIAKGTWIQREDLFLQTDAWESGNGDRSLKTAMSVFKANFIRKVLDENNWNQTDAARVLGIQRTYLSKLINDLNLQHNSEE
jgi:Nif-specific regulatory protein